MNKLITYRQYIIALLVLTLFVCFSISYAISNIATFALVGVFFLDSKQQLSLKFKAFKTSKLVWCYVMFFIIQLIGLLYSKNLTEGFRRIEVMLPIILVAPIVCLEYRINTKLKQQLFLAIQVLIPLLFLLLVFIHIYIDHKIFSTFVHFTIEEKLGVSQFYLAFILLVPMLLSIQSIKMKQNYVVSVLSLIFCLSFLFLLGNKTILVFLIFIALYETYKLYHIKKRLALILLMGSVVLGCFAYKVPIVNQRVGVLIKTTDLDFKTIKTKNKFTQTKNTFEHRLYINYISLQLISQNLPFGLGTGDVQDALLEAYRNNKFKVAQMGNYNPHNQYLNEFLRTGILGGLLFILLLFYLFKTTHRNPIGFQLVLFFSIACFVESYLVRQHGVTILAVIIPFFIKNKYEKS